MDLLSNQSRKRLTLARVSEGQLREVQLGRYRGTKEPILTLCQHIIIRTTVITPVNGHQVRDCFGELVERYILELFCRDNVHHTRHRIS